jgi:hypothetical protein
VEEGKELLDTEDPAASGLDLASPHPGSEEPAGADPALASPDPGSEEPADADPDLANPGADVAVGETLPDFVEASPGAATAGRLLPHPTTTFSHALLNDLSVSFPFLTPCSSKPQRT